jgi:hypothetical protein
MMTLSFLFYGTLYVILWIGLFLLNMYIYERMTPFKVKNEVYNTQNNALWRIVRWQLVGQALMISLLIYFLWLSYDHTLSLMEVVYSFLELWIFWILWILILQWALLLLNKYFDLEREIMEDKNESMGMIVEWFLIALSLIISVSLFSY